MTTLTTRMWSKPTTQQAIKQLRNAGLTVNKAHYGYKCQVGDQVVFKAMIGTQGYLVRYDEKMFE